jgi:hypothetical protein
MGRKTTYTEKAAGEICRRLAEGEPLRQICRDDHLPAWQTVYGWIEARPDFAKRIACARELGFDAIAEQALEIADTPQIGETVETSEDGKKVKREDMIAHRKLQVETRLKLLAKWAPKKYGESIRQELTGANGGPIQMQFSATDADL